MNALSAGEAGPRRQYATALALGVWGAGVAVFPGTAARLALALPPVVAGAVWWATLRAHRWLLLFFPCLLLTPPISGPVGDAGLHLAPAFVALGIFVGFTRLREWDRRISPLGAALLGFTAILLASVGLAALYSGPEIALGSLLRVGLFAIGVFVFLWASIGPHESGWNPLAMGRFLFLIAMAAALFACADFYYQFPAPAGFGQQFIWLPDEVLRRAQGLFYEASTLGNFCALFLVMIAVALLRPRAEAPCSRLLLGMGGLVLTTALILSCSRASVLNVAVSLAALAMLRGAKFRKPLLLSVIVAALAVLTVSYALPSFSADYWARLGNTFRFFGYSPDGVLSGRLHHWSMLAGFLAREPWHLLFGVGYKTLAYSNVAGEPVIADNTYLSVLAETGVVGFVSFALLNAAILRSALRAARRAGTSFFGEWIFCFWVGELAQMFSGDLITYWRVLPVCFWVLGTAVRE